jgi:NAD(P)-dependent dehydrogenase (short-subunit alcohol dehydrogenase family)
MSNNIAGKVIAVITGASSGLGEATARLLSAAREKHASSHPGFQVDGRQARNDLCASRARGGVQLRQLRSARYTEPFALLVAQLAYEGEGGPELAYRFERFRAQA